MKPHAFVSLLLIIAAAGCSGSGRKTDAVAASAPHVIKELTNQTAIYVCPECQMEYDRAGKCTMCKVDLVATRVAYLCPADGKPVEHAGKCPRCEVNAKVIKTAMAGGTPGTATGN